jgi:hypothetical protein
MNQKKIKQDVTLVFNLICSVYSYLNQSRDIRVELFTENFIPLLFP